VGAIEHQVLSQKPTDPIRHGIVYFANPDLGGVLWQFDEQGGVKGSSSMADLFALLERTSPSIASVHSPHCRLLGIRCALEERRVLHFQMRIFRRQKEPSTFPKSNGEAQ